MTCSTRRDDLVAIIKALRILNLNRSDMRKNPSYDSRAASPLVTALQRAGISHIDSVKSRLDPSTFIPGHEEEA